MGELGVGIAKVRGYIAIPAWILEFSDQDLKVLRGIVIPAWMPESSHKEVKVWIRLRPSCLAVYNC